MKKIFTSVFLVLGLSTYGQEGIDCDLIESSEISNISSTPGQIFLNISSCEQFTNDGWVKQFTNITWSYQAFDGGAWEELEEYASFIPEINNPGQYCVEIVCGYGYFDLKNNSELENEEYLCSFEQCYDIYDLNDDECSIYGLDLEYNYDANGNIECDSGSFDVVVDFEYADVTSDWFDLYVDGELFNYYLYSDLPISITIESSSQQYYWIEISDNDNSDCFLVLDGIENPCLEEDDCIDQSLISNNIFCPEIYDPVCGCDGVTYDNSCQAENWYGVTSWIDGSCEEGNCEIDIVMIEPWDCDSNGYFNVDIQVISNAEVFNSTGFEIVGNGENYGQYDYGSDYYTVEGVAPNSSGIYEFIIQDLDNEDCSDFIELVWDCGAVNNDCQAYFEAYNDTTEELASSLMFVFAEQSVSSSQIVSWEWSMGGAGIYIFGNASSQYPIYQYFTEGEYNACLTIVDSEGCQATYCQIISSEPSSSIEEQGWLSKTKLYPNPTAGNVVLEFSKPIEMKTNIRLLNPIGQVVLEQTALEPTYRLLLPTRDLISGIYIVQIESVNGEYVFYRFTKTK